MWKLRFIFIYASWTALIAVMPAPIRADGSINGEIFLANGAARSDGSLIRTHRLSAGIDAVQFLSSESGDWATAALQLRYANVQNLAMDNRFDNRFIQRSGDWSAEIHDAYINLRGMNGRANLRLGRFKTPFGLNPVIDFHTELIPSLAMSNGIPARRWGASLNGQLDSFDYEAAVLGGNLRNPLDKKAGEWTASARVQPYSDGVMQYGLSALWKHQAGESIQDGEQRAAFDLRTVFFAFNGTIEPRIELSVGRKGGKRIFGIEATADRSMDPWRLTLSARAHQDDAWAIASLRREFSGGPFSLAWETAFTQELTDSRRPALLMLFYTAF